MFCTCCIAAKGFYLKYDEMKTDPNVQKWDVQVLTVSYATARGRRGVYSPLPKTLTPFQIKKAEIDTRFLIKKATKP